MPLRPDEPLFRIADLVERLNRVSRPRSDGRPRWNRWSVIRLLQKKRCKLVQAVDGGPFLLTPTALRECWPEFYEDLLDAEAAIAAGRRAA